MAQERLQDLALLCIESELAKTIQSLPHLRPERIEKRHCESVPSVHGDIADSFIVVMIH